VDVEGLYAPGLPRPEALPSGSSGYAHRTAREGLWGPTADRFAGAVLLAEMLGWGDETVREACYGETYFDPAEMPAQGGSNPPRYRTLIAALARHYGQPVADLFERAWTSETLADCPTFGEWLVALPEHPVAQAFSLFTAATETAEAQASTSPEEVTLGVVRGLIQAARRMEDKGNLENALELYRQALELAQSDPSLRSLAREIELTVQDVEKRVAAQASRLQPAVSPLPSRAPFGEDKGPGVRAVSPLPVGDGAGVRVEPARPTSSLVAVLLPLSFTLLGLGLTVAFLATNDSYLLLSLTLMMVGSGLVSIIDYFNERKKHRQAEDSLVRVEPSRPTSSLVAVLLSLGFTLLGLGLTVAFLATNASYLLLSLSLMIGSWLVGIINYFNERKKYKRTEDSLYQSRF
jgi:hypothetical protein